MKLFAYIFSLLVLLTVVDKNYAQSIQLTTKSKAAIKNYRLAETSYKSSDFEQALNYLAKAVKKDNNFIEAWLLLGDVNTELNQKQEAIDAFNEAIRIDSSFFPRAYYFIGNLAFEMGAYKRSENYLKRYLQFKEEQKITRLLAAQKLQRAIFADSLVSNPINTIPVNLGKLVNTSSDEYVNFVNENQSQIILTRKYKVDTNNLGVSYYGERFYETKSDNGTWTNPMPMELSWQKGLNLGGMSLSVDGRKMYFTGCNWPDGYGSCDIFISVKQGDLWQKPMNLGSVINSNGWESQPFVSADGKRIFFSSKRSGGKGGSDIWMTIKLNNGKWSPPVNLGDSINTAGNEMSPFLHPDGETLYFSSDGHEGLGGADLFISRKDELGRWSKAKNLGYPVNSRANEINIFLTIDGNWSYISSDRKEGEGGYDIYKLETPSQIKPRPVYFVKGVVVDKANSMPLEANIELTNLEDGLVENEMRSDSQNGEFLMVLHHDHEYAFNITKPGYLFNSEHFNPVFSDSTTAIEKVFKLEPISSGGKMILNNVFFEFDRATLNSKSYIELDKLFTFLKENPVVHILIGGHTDNVGEDIYNQKLSHERAKVVYQYLVDHGISSDRLEIKGFGASQPVADNDTEKGRSLNRRTEITIL
jgi:outer membrane protein OmpA-like peptidoglycan-associated protein